jgi:hypothetical protein
VTVRETTRGEWIQPHFVPHLPFYVLQIYLVFNWSILKDNVKTHLFFEFRFDAFPGKTIRLNNITCKSPATATLILAGGHT